MINRHLIIFFVCFYSCVVSAGIKPRAQQSDNRVYFDWVKSGDPTLWKVRRSDGKFADIGPIIDKVNNPKGHNLPVPVNIAAKVPSKALTLAMLKPLARAVPVLGTALALKDFMDGIPDNYYSDYTLGDDAKLYKKNTGEDACYRVHTGGGPSDCYPSGSTACKAVYGSAYPDIRYLQSTDTSGECRNFHIEIGYGVSLTKLETSPPPRLATIEELASDIDSQPNWPQSMLDKSADLINSGAHPELIPTPENTAVTGPSSGTGSSTVSQTSKPNGDIVTSTTNQTYNYTYNNNTINWTKTDTVTTVTTKPDQSTETEVTTETETNPVDDLPPNDPDPPPDLCEKNPDILACKKLEEPEQTEIPKETRTIKLVDGPTFSGGSCIPDVMATVNGQSIKILETSTPCGWISDFFKPLILLLASISAVFIVMPRDS